MKLGRKCSLGIAIGLAALMARADSLVLKNGSRINGKFIGGTQTEITFKVGSSLQKYDLADISSLQFDSETSASEALGGMSSPLGNEATTNYGMQQRASVTIPPGTLISVRMIDGVDSTKNQVGDRFQASLAEPLMVDGNVVIDKGADVYGRLAESKTSGTFAGRSELQLELTGVVVNGRTVPLVTGDYELNSKSRGASTAKRTIGGAAVGSIIGAIAGGGKGAAIGAGAGGGLGAGSEIITKGDQVKIPSETLIEFTLQQEVLIPRPRA